MIDDRVELYEDYPSEWPSDFFDKESIDWAMVGPKECEPISRSQPAMGSRLWRRCRQRVCAQVGLGRR
jgi:hypothetical protein